MSNNKYQVTYSISFNDEKLKECRMMVPGDEELDAWDKTIKFIKNRVSFNVSRIELMPSEHQRELSNKSMDSAEMMVEALKSLEDIKLKDGDIDYEDVEKIRIIAKAWNDAADLFEELI